jgi:ribulose-5-phosphate 4-epimerase/fuculose-1-phosphate aldolase
MAMKLVSNTAETLIPDTAEWQARVDLAAAHRLAHMHGLSEGIFNHLTLTVPGKPGRYYQIPFGMHWAEVTASSIMEVSFEGEVLSGKGEVERSAFCIHAPIHKLNPNEAAVFHTHQPYASALARLEDPQILPIGQTEVGFLNKTAYDDTYTGLAFDPAEGERLCRVMGDKTVMFMANHGVVTVGKTVAEAYDRLYYLERAAQVQLYAMWTGQRLKHLSKEVVDRTVWQFKNESPSYYGKPSCEHHFAALKRMLDRKEPDYAD